MKDKKGICIQIGLKRTAELLYLTRPDWKSIMPTVAEENKRLYTEFDFDRWDYFGIDCDPGSITGMLGGDVRTREDFPYNVDNAHWINCLIVPCQKPYLRKIKSAICTEECYVVSVSLEFIVQQLNLPKIDVLVMDIEGDEVDVLGNYNFDIKPSYIIVETHSNRELIENILHSQNYVQIYEGFNIHNPGDEDDKDIHFSLTIR